MRRLLCKMFWFTVGSFFFLNLLSNQCNKLYFSSGEPNVPWIIWISKINSYHSSPLSNFFVSSIASSLEGNFEAPVLVTSLALFCIPLSGALLRSAAPWFLNSFFFLPSKMAPKRLLVLAFTRYRQNLV